MAITTSEPVPQSVVDEIVASDGFVAGQTVVIDRRRHPRL